MQFDFISLFYLFISASALNGGAGVKAMLEGLKKLLGLEREYVSWEEFQKILAKKK